MDARKGTGMVGFASILIVLTGTFNVMDGIVAVVNSDYFVNKLLFANLDAWGWFFIAYGAVQVAVGFALFGGSRFAQWAGILVAGFNMLAQLAFVRSYPAWSLIAIGLDAAVIYALAAYGTVFSQPDATTLDADRAEARRHTPTVT